MADAEQERKELEYEKIRARQRTLRWAHNCRVNSKISAVGAVLFFSGAVVQAALQLPEIGIGTSSLVGALFAAYAVYNYCQGKKYTKELEKDNPSAQAKQSKLALGLRQAIGYLTDKINKER